MAPLCKRCETRHYGTELVLCNRPYAARNAANEVPALTAVGSPQVVNGAVNVKPVVNRRGSYPNTDERREYMRLKMRERRAKH